MYTRQRVYKPVYASTKVPSRGQALRSAQTARRLSAYAVRRSIVPGVTRTAGAYRRSNPQNTEETHYNDTTCVTTSTAAGVLANWTCVSPSAAAPANPNTASLVAIAQSTTKNTRIGNKLHLYAIRIKGQITLPTAAFGDVLRLILVQDTQANGASATANQVLEGNGAAGVATVNDFFNMDNIDRFKILKDKYFNMNGNIGVANTSQTPVVKEFKMNHKCRARIDYSSTAGAITELKSNNFFLIVISENGLSIVGATARVYWKE